MGFLMISRYCGISRASGSTGRLKAMESFCSIRVSINLSQWRYKFLRLPSVGARSSRLRGLLPFLRFSGRITDSFVLLESKYRFDGVLQQDVPVPCVPPGYTCRALVLKWSSKRSRYAVVPEGAKDIGVLEGALHEEAPARTTGTARAIRYTRVLSLSRAFSCSVG